MYASVTLFIDYLSVNNFFPQFLIAFYSNEEIFAAPVLCVIVCGGKSEEGSDN